MSEHTPGPWSVGSGGCAIYGDGTRRICRLDPQTFGDRSGNARLIAAAPDLLEVAKRVEGVFSKASNELAGQGFLEICGVANSWICQLRRAIAKAEGSE